MKVISTFKDPATGRYVGPGDDVPELSEETTRRLVRARCLEPELSSDVPARVEPAAKKPRSSRSRKTGSA